MKKAGAIVAAVVLGVAFLPVSGFASESSAEPPIALSRINTKNGSEFVQLFNNSGADLGFERLNIEWFNSASTSQKTFTSTSKRFVADGFLLIKQGGTAQNSDDSWGASTNKITPDGGRLVVKLDGEEIANICWGKITGDDCRETISPKDDAVFISNTCQKSAICNSPSAETQFGGIVDQPKPPIDPDPDPEPKPETPQYCSALRLSEVSVNEQWVELYNSSARQILPENLADCHLLVQKGETLELNDYNLPLSNLSGFSPYEYYVVDITTTSELSLPKSKNRVIMIYNEADTYSDDMTYSAHKTDTSLAYFGAGDWRTTYAPSPSAENIYQQWQTCETGKHINEATGNCIKDPDPPAECAEGQFRNPATGRCKKNPEPKILAECAEGQFRNPATNRCKKIATDDDLTPCAEGWERNPETNRCRKVATGETALFGVEPATANTDNTGWILAGGGLLAIAGLVAWQFRPEISRLASKIGARVKK